MVPPAPPRGICGPFVFSRSCIRRFERNNELSVTRYTKLSMEGGLVAGLLSGLLLYQKFVGGAFVRFSKLYIPRGFWISIGQPHRGPFSVLRRENGKSPTNTTGEMEGRGAWSGLELTGP